MTFSGCGSGQPSTSRNCWSGLSTGHRGERVLQREGQPDDDVGLLADGGLDVLLDRGRVVALEDVELQPLLLGGALGALDRELEEVVAPDGVGGDHDDRAGGVPAVVPASARVAVGTRREAGEGHEGERRQPAPATAVDVVHRVSLGAGADGPRREWSGDTATGAAGRGRRVGHRPRRPYRDAVSRSGRHPEHPATERVAGQRAGAWRWHSGPSGKLTRAPRGPPLVSRGPGRRLGTPGRRTAGRLAA